MSVNPDDPNGQPVHTYAVTHYVRPPGEFASWQSFSSAEHSAEDAIAWIREHVAGSRDANLVGAVSAPEQPEVSTPAEPPAEPEPAASEPVSAAEPEVEPAT